MDTISVGFVLKSAVMCLPPIKRNQEHTQACILTLLSFLSFTYSYFSLFFTLRGHGSWIFHCRYIYVLLSHIVAMYLYIVDLYLFSLWHFSWHILYNAIYIFHSYFLNFIRYDAIYIYILLFHILAMYIYASIYIYLVCYILYNEIYIFIVIFLEFY